MPLVKYLGSANSYTVKGVTFFKEKPDVTVEGDVWAYLQNVRDDSGNRMFTEIDPPAVAPRVESHDVLDKYQVGNFKSKEEAVAYAYDVHGVYLNPDMNRDDLNAQTVEIFKRFERGWKGKKLVDGLKGASISDVTQVVQSIAPVEEPKPLDLNDDGELDTAQTEAPPALMNQLEDNAEAMQELTERAEALKEALEDATDSVDEEVPAEDKPVEEMKKVVIKRPPPKKDEVVPIE